MNGQTVHVAAEQSQANIKVKLEEQDEQSEADNYFENPQQQNTIKLELDQPLDWCDIGAEIHLYKEVGASECDDKDPNQEQTKPEESDVLHPINAGADGTQLVVQEEGSVTWLIQDYKLSLKTGKPGDAGQWQEEAKSKNGPSDNVATAEQHEAEDVEASEPAGGGKSLYEIENVC